MTRDEIYRLYRKADYDSPKLLQVLADVAGIDMYELLNIIKQKENDKMAQHKWTDEENAEMLRLANNGASYKEIAEKFNTTVGNISFKICAMRKQAKAAVEPEQTIDDLPSEPVNAEIAKLCETPDPVDLDPIDEAAIALRAHQAQAEPAPILKPRTLFTELHSVLYTAEATAKRNGMAATRLSVDVDGGKIHIRIWDETDNEIYIGKKYQPDTEEKQ